MTDLKEFLKDKISLVEALFYENRIVNFRGARPDYNQCVILAGGAASGKGSIGKKIDLNAKKFDVDDLKQLYLKLQKKGKIDDKRDYDMANSDDTGALHMKVKEKGWKHKERNNFFNHQSSNANKDLHLSNIIFDMVSDDIKDIEEAATMAKKCGYTVTLVWVVTNQNTAKVNNALRGIGPKEKRRSVPNHALEKGHNGAYKTITDFLSNKYPELNELVDYAWIGFGTGYYRSLKPEFEKSPVRKIKKVDDEWQFDKNLIDSFLKEEQPINDEAIKKAYDEAKSFNGDEKENYELLKLKKAAEMNEEIAEYLKKNNMEL